MTTIRYRSELLRCLDAVQPIIFKLFLGKYESAFGSIDDAEKFKKLLKTKSLELDSSQLQIMKEINPSEWDISLLTKILISTSKFQLSESTVNALKETRHVRNWCSHLSTETIPKEDFEKNLRRLQYAVGKLPDGGSVDLQLLLMTPYHGNLLPSGGGRFDEGLLKYLSYTIRSNQLPKECVFVVGVTMPSDHDIICGQAMISPKFEATGVFFEEGYKKTSSPVHYHAILQLLNITYSMRNDSTTSRVILLIADGTFSYFIYQVNSLTEDDSSNRLFNMNKWIPCDLLYSEDEIDQKMQKCVPVYNGDIADYESIGNYLISNGFDLDTAAYQNFDHIEILAAWLRQSRRKGRLINRRQTIPGLAKEFIRARPGIFVNADSMRIALVATGHRLERNPGSDYANSFPILSIVVNTKF